MKNNTLRPLILISNDDGYQAQGINVLARLMHQLGDVMVVAPDSARSGAACSITSTTPIRLTKVSEEPGLTIFSCSGSPVDCVKLALEQVCDRMPDLLVSGINHGDNASISIHYSGTMGAVIEGCMKGIPSIGYSLRTLSQQCDFSPYEEVVTNVAQHVLENGLPHYVCLNVNFPEITQLRGTRVCRLAQGTWSSEWVPAHNPRGQKYFWLAGRFTNMEPEAEDSDYYLLDQGFATVTPIQMDMTAYGAMKDLMVLNS